MTKIENLKPVIFQIEEDDVSLKKFEERLQTVESEKVQDLILNYPTVYIHNWKKSNDYEVYTLLDGSKEKFGEILIQHEVRVLMTRGVNGLYIYACDEELRKALKDAAI